MDITENGITAGADLINIRVNEAQTANRLEIIIQDNGKGISPDHIVHVTNPFVTSRTTRRVGLGLSLFKATAEHCDGEFKIESELGRGTCVTASFRYDHIDRAPVGDMAATIMVLIAGNPAVDFVYEHVVNGKAFDLDTRELKRDLQCLNLTDPAVIHHLTQTIRNHLEQLDQGRPTSTAEE